MKNSTDRLGETVPAENHIYEFEYEPKKTRKVSPIGAEMRDFSQDADDQIEVKPTSRGDRGLIIVSNKEEDSTGKVTTRSDDDIVKTMLHELGVHAGLLNQALPFEHKDPKSRADEFEKTLNTLFSKSAQPAQPAPPPPPEPPKAAPKPAPPPSPPKK